MTLSSEVQDWFLSERGIKPETLTRFGIAQRGDGAVVFPYSNGEKVRKGIPNGERQMFFTAGQKPDLFGPAETKATVFLVEGETDTMRLDQELVDDGVSDVTVLGLPGIETWRDDLIDRFAGVEKVYVILDNDADYNVQGRVDQAFRDIRASLGKRVQRVRLPRDVKDTCEFFKFYDLDVLRMLCQRRALSDSRFQVLNLQEEPPPVKWLVEGFLCQGDMNLFIGEPGIGKSWLTMSLALAVAGGRPDWIGHKMLGQGRVLYVDEENPQDLIYDRMHKMGMTDEEAKNIRYLNNIGIRLDRQADELIDEALEFEPTLIILDSLTRFHTGDEDKAGNMSALYNDALKPLTRETGACVVLLHHANKSDSNSSYRRSRGSGEIVANVDAGFDVRPIGVGLLTVANFKSRRRQVGDPTVVSIRDTEDGVEVVGTEEMVALF